ncbi:AAA family ATPase [Nonomuraea antimicrobica]
MFTVQPRPPVTGRPTAESLDPESLLRGRRNAPSKGWRRVVYKASGGWIKPGEPPEVRRRRELITRARTPVTAGHHRVAVLSLKGGVGKTTTTVGLGATLAQMRGDRVIAVDANPDRGTLSDKLVLETSATVRDLLNERDQVKRYVDIRAFTSQAPSRLEVLASDRDPSVSEAFSGADYQAVSQVLENFYSICITDCGTGLLHSAMGGVLGLADQIVLVSSPSVDGARAASATLDWLEAHHHGDLVKNATVVLCSVRPRSKSAVDIKKLEAHFAARCRAVIRVPYDPHLEEGPRSTSTGSRRRPETRTSSSPPAWARGSRASASESRAGGPARGEHFRTARRDASGGGHLVHQPGGPRAPHEAGQERAARLVEVLLDVRDGRVAHLDGHVEEVDGVRPVVVAPAGL